MARLSKAQFAGNVVALPNAASRKVDNRRYAAQRGAARAACKAEPWPRVFIFPGVREQESENRMLAEALRSPELLIVMTMFELMSPQDQQRLASKVEARQKALTQARSVNQDGLE